jgi:hypothetical protein
LCTKEIAGTINQVTRINMQEDDQQQSQSPLASGTDIPIGMSASQLGLDTAGAKYDKLNVLKKAMGTILILILLLGGYGLLEYMFTGMATKTLSNGGYTYSFTFNKRAGLVHLNDGSAAYKYSSSIIASIKPTNDVTPVSCSEIGAQWKQAFTVQVYGATRLVCTPNDAGYSMFFTALNHNHLFSVVYSKQQPTSVYSKLKTVFGSVKVSP